MGNKKGLVGMSDGRHFDREIIVLCVRWLLGYKLSLGDLVEATAERGLVGVARVFRRLQILRKWSYGRLCCKYGR
jgi:transposase-like protein